MRKILLLLSALFFTFGLNAQTAVNFNCNDCSAVNHDLFTELDAGNVIVICWVMPCSSCIGPAIACSTSVDNYATQNQGRVKFYLCDDSGNTPCSTLGLWASTNGMHPTVIFSNSAISMTDYGLPGMPKIVVLAGTSHSIFFSNEGPLIIGNFNLAVDAALAATSVNENSISVSEINLFPNPSNTNSSILNYNLTQSADVTIAIYSSLGEQVSAVNYGNEGTGKHEVALELSSLSNGIYFVKLIAGEESQTLRLVIAE